jgi:hypothetical protein
MPDTGFVPGSKGSPVQIRPSRPEGPGQKGSGFSLGPLFDLQEPIGDLTPVNAAFRKSWRQSWQRIGQTIGWEHNAAAHAFAAATASPWLDIEAGQWRDDKTFAWHCSACGEQVVDYGTGAEAEKGHATECPRHATT